MNNDETCNNCHYRVDKRCRRYPPIKVGNYFLYPEITLDLNCGEWEERTEDDIDILDE